MNNHEFFAASLAGEIPVLRRVIDAMPADKMSYTPHERSSTAGVIAWTMASELDNIAGILEHGDLLENHGPLPKTKGEILALFDQAAGQIAERMPKMTEERWDKIGRFVVGGREVNKMPAGMLAWSMHNDLIHHRGQLSTYLRPMGAKVPSIYGPSADERGGN